MEDAAIHLAMAKDLWSEGFFSLTRGIPAGAVTSPLWVFLESIVLAISSSPLVTVTALGMLTLGVFTLQLWNILSFHSREIAAITVTLTLMSGPIQWHIWSGMETLLFGGFILGSLDAFQRNQYRRCGWWAALAILTRMEGILLMGAPLLSLMLKRNDSIELTQKRVKIMAIPLLAFIIFGLINWTHTGHFMPTTGDGKRFLYGIYLHGADAIAILPSRFFLLLEDWAFFIHGAFSKNGNEILFWISYGRRG